MIAVPYTSPSHYTPKFCYLRGQASIDFCQPASGVSSWLLAASSIRQRTTRGCTSALYRLSTFAGRAFSVDSQSVWKSLPDYLRDPAAGRDTFKQHLKRFLFATYSTYWGIYSAFEVLWHCGIYNIIGQNLLFSLSRQSGMCLKNASVVETTSFYSHGVDQTGRQVADNSNSKAIFTY